uniref:skin secretory protein xP2-like n=1 Tax=Jaculus jaculus TaxID=51337 RepID=UPI001E1B1AC5|nr:skin secretory protein xP2-like [Jaculus jaculus]
MAISGGPRRLAGLQRTPAAYANEAALAISGRAGEEGPAAPAELGARCPAPLTSLAPPPALHGGPGAAPAGPSRVRRGAAAATPPRGSGSKLWWRPRGAVSAGAPGSPLYRVSAPSPAPPRRRRRHRRRRAAPPGASGRGQGSGPAPLSRRGRSGSATVASCAPGRPAAFVPSRRVVAPFGSSPPPTVPAWARAQVPFSLRTFSAGSCPSRRLSPAAGLARNACGRSGEECARRGGGTSARPTFRGPVWYEASAQTASWRCPSDPSLASPARLSAGFFSVLDPGSQPACFRPPLVVQVPGRNSAGLRRAQECCVDRRRRAERRSKRRLKSPPPPPGEDRSRSAQQPPGPPVMDSSWLTLHTGPPTFLSPPPPLGSSKRTFCLPYIFLGASQLSCLVSRTCFVFSMRCGLQEDPLKSLQRGRI